MGHDGFRLLSLFLVGRFRRVAQGSGGGDALVVQAKELDGAGHVPGTVDAVADPSGVGENVVRQRAAAFHQLAAHVHGKGQVRQTVAVQVPDLVPQHAELDSAEAVGPGLHARPPAYFIDDRSHAGLPSGGESKS